MMNEKNNCIDLFKVDCIEMDKITEVSEMPDLGVLEKLEKIYEDVPISRSDLVSLQILLVVIESIIQSEGMRDERLTDLNQEELEDMALEMYLKIEVIGSLYGYSYGDMGKCVNEVIKKRLSADFPRSRRLMDKYIHIYDNLDEEKGSKDI